MTDTPALKNPKIYITGYIGMLGLAILRQLQVQGITNIILRSYVEFDLCNQQQVRDFMQSEKIDYIVLATAKVAGILANNAFPVKFIYQNIIMIAKIIYEAWAAVCTFTLQLKKETYQANMYPMLSRINMGVGEGVTMAEWVQAIKGVTSFDIGQPEFQLAHETESTDQYFSEIQG